MNIECKTPIRMEKPRLELSTDKKSYFICFPLPEERVDWLKVYLEDGFLEVRAQFRVEKTISEDSEASTQFYRQTIPLPSNLDCRTFFPLLENDKLRLTLLRAPSSVAS